MTGTRRRRLPFASASPAPASSAVAARSSPMVPETKMKGMSSPRARTMASASVPLNPGMLLSPTMMSHSLRVRAASTSAAVWTRANRTAKPARFSSRASNSASASESSTKRRRKWSVMVATQPNNSCVQVMSVIPDWSRIPYTIHTNEVHSGEAGDGWRCVLAHARRRERVRPGGFEPPTNSLEGQHPRAHTRPSAET
jgi:hypothetical protein